MTAEALGLLLLLGALLVLPFLPGVREWWRPGDDRPLEIEQRASGHPRERAEALRRALAPVLDQIGPDLGPGAEVGLDPARRLAVHQQVRVPAEARVGGLLVGLRAAELGEGAAAEEIYVRGDARLAGRASVRILAADGDAVLGPVCVVEDWIDSEGTLWVGPGCRLGHSASAAKGLHLGEGCRFTRLWGLPIASDARPADRAPADAAAPDPGPAIDDWVVWAGRRLSLPAGLVLDRDLVVRGEVRVGPRSVIRGSIKAHGPLSLAEEVRVEGNLICRGSIRIAGPAHVTGSIYAEGDVVLGAGSQVGQPEAHKTVYARGTVTLSPDVLVFGGIVADRAGSVV